jgi:hypothetical protein
MPQRPRRPRRNHQQRIGFESLESRQVLTAAFVDVDPDLWAWDAGVESADIGAESWVASDGWYDDSWWIDDGSWVDDSWWSDEGSWSNDDWWVTADWSGDDAVVGTDVATAVVDAGSGLQTAITVDAGSSVSDDGSGSGWSAVAPEVVPGPEAETALETSGVSLERQDVVADFFAPAEPSSEPVIDVLWDTVSEGFTDVTVAAVTSEISAGDREASVTDPTSYEVSLGSNDPAPEALDDAAVTEWDETVLAFDDPVTAFDDPAAVFDDPAAVVDDPAAVVDDPAAVVDDPAAVVDDPAAVFDDPAAVFDDPAAVFDDPVTVFDDPAAVVATTTVPPRQTPAQVGVSAGRSTSWFGMFMRGFGGFSAASDPASLSDSEIPGRGRRGRLPFRPAN